MCSFIRSLGADFVPEMILKYHDTKNLKQASN
jgi:hypothetical protein